jgi:hypothetical protein
LVGEQKRLAERYQIYRNIFIEILVVQIDSVIDEGLRMYAEVVTFVAGSLEAGGLPGYPEVF